MPLSLLRPLLAASLLLTATTATARADDKQRPLESLPLPSPAGKPLAAAPGQKSFRVPLGFTRVEKFYREQFASEPRVTIAVERGTAGRTLTLSSKRSTDSWIRAVAREGAIDTQIEVTPVIRVQSPEVVDGHPAQPLVHFVMPPNAEVKKQADSIDHMAAHK